MARPPSGSRPRSAAKRDGVEIEGQILKGELVQHHRALPAGHRADSCQQLLWVKGLGEIVVRPSVQSRHLVGNGGAGGEHQHRGLHALASHLPQYAEAVQPREHDVQQDEVIRAGADIVQRGLPVRHPVCAVSRLAENVRYRLRQGGFIFYNKNVQRNPSFFLPLLYAET